MKSNNKSNYIFIPLLVVVTFITAFFLYKISLNPTMGDNFDISIHNNLAREIFTNNKTLFDTAYYESFQHVFKYPLYHIIVNLFSKILFNNFTLSGAVVLALSNALNSAITRMIICRIAKPKTNTQRLLIDIFSVLCIFMMPIVGYLTNGYFYKYISSPNIWHNPTYTLVKPLGMISVWFFINIIEKAKEEKPYFKDAILFAVFCVISALAKPSYSFFILPAMGIYTLIFVLKNFKLRYKPGLVILLCVIPVGLVLIWQSFSIFDIGNNISTAIKFGGYGNLTFSQVLKATVAVLPIPILAYCCDIKKIFKSPWLSLALLGLIIGWTEMFFLDIKNSIILESTGDFSWQYSLSVFLTAITSAAYLFKRFFAKNNISEKIIFSVFVVLFMVQIYFGIKYFCYFVSSGGIYYF